MPIAGYSLELSFEFLKIFGDAIFYGWLTLKTFLSTNFWGYGQNPQKLVPRKSIPHELM